MYFAVLFVSLENCLADVDEVEFQQNLKNLETRSSRQSERSSSTYKVLEALKNFGDKILTLGLTLTDQKVTLLFLVDVVNEWCCSNLRPSMIRKWDWFWASKSSP